LNRIAHHLGLIFLISLIVAGCQTTPISAPSNELQTETLLLLCEHAVFAEASRRPIQREDFQNCLDILDVMLDDPISRKNLCQALLLMGVRDFIAPDGGLIKLSEKDILVNGRSISDEVVYDVANAFWVGLNKSLNPTPR
jgi:hypothetical protein